MFSSFFRVQIKMSAPVMKQMIATPTPFAPTLKGRMSVAVLVDIRAMVETARVNIFLICGSLTRSKVLPLAVIFGFISFLISLFSGNP